MNYLLDYIERTFQRHWQHWAQMTHDEDKYNTKSLNTNKTRVDPDKQFFLLVRLPPCSSYCQVRKKPLIRDKVKKTFMQKGNDS